MFAALCHSVLANTATNAPLPSSTTDLLHRAPLAARPQSAPASPVQSKQSSTLTISAGDIAPDYSGYCRHFQSAIQLVPDRLKSYRRLIAWSLRSGYRKIWPKLPVILCHDCASGFRLHACLDCVNVGCLKHFRGHSNLAKNHSGLSVDLASGHLFCNLCEDYVYDQLLEDILWSECLAVYKQLMLACRPDDARKIIGDYYTNQGKNNDLLSKDNIRLNWLPTEKEYRIIQERSTIQSHLGVRGLLNLGSTCFMNVVLQCFVQNPPLRQYFLSDRHNSKFCRLDEYRCLACQMDKLFSAFYSGDISPMAPSDFLAAMWVSCSQLAGYAQQDAHEFFIGLLDGIHNNLVQTNTFSPIDGDHHACSCIIHQTFSGTFQSTVTCLHCGNQTFAYDPFIDISLDVRPVFSPVVVRAIEQSTLEEIEVIAPEKQIQVEYQQTPSNDPMETDDITPASAAPSTRASRRSSLAHGSSSTNTRNTRQRSFVGGTAISANENSSTTSRLSRQQSPMNSPTAKTGVSPHKEKSVALQQSLSETHTLYECFDQFTHKERLSPLEYRCGKCNANRSAQSLLTADKSLGAIKQLSLKRLPIVLSLQLKRFDHRLVTNKPLQYSTTFTSPDPSLNNLPKSFTGNFGQSSAGIDARGGKINMMVQFPLELDLEPYTTESMMMSTNLTTESSPKQQKTQLNLTPENKNYSRDTMKIAPTVYTLFAVIVHDGTLNSGHYVCFVRQTGGGRRWFCYNDHMVTVVDWEDVKNCQAYMCFYIQKCFSLYGDLNT